MNFNVPESGRAVLRGIVAGDRFLLALTRPAPTPTPTPTPEPTLEPAADDARSSSEPADGDLPATTATTGIVVLDQAARGTIHGEVQYQYDGDWFAMDLAAGRAYQVQVLGALGADCTMLAPIIESVRDASGTVVPGTEWWIEDRGPWYRLSFTPESAGRYYIAVVGEANYAGVGTYIVALTDGGAGHADRIAAIGAQGCLPEAPTGLGLSDVTGGSVTLSWTAPAHSGVSAYKVLRGTDAASLSVIAKDTGGTATRYVDTGVSPSTAYFYAVAALSPAGAGAPSITASATTPGTGNAERTTEVPGSTGLTLTSSFDWVDLAWGTPPDDAVTGFRIWRGTAADSLSVLVSDTSAASVQVLESTPWTLYRDETVEADTTYHYAVAALNANGEGEQSTSSIATLSAPRIINVPRSEPQIAAQQSFSDNPVVTFASNLGQADAAGTSADNTLNSSDGRLQKSFTTGPGELGFLLHSFSFEAWNGNDFLTVSLWTDDGVGPGEKLAEIGRTGRRNAWADYTFEYLDVFLFPSTTYWVQFDVRYWRYETSEDSVTTLFRKADSTAMDAGSLAGWSFGDDTKFGLKGRVVPLTSRDGPPPAEALVSRLIGVTPDDSGNPLISSDDFHAQPFRTGSHRLGYDIASVSFLGRLGGAASAQPVVTMHGDNNGVPADAALFTFTGPPITGASYAEYTFTAPAGSRLKPDTDYWLEFTASAGGAGIADKSSGNILQIDSGWDIPGRRYWRGSPTDAWSLSAHAQIMFTLSGSCPGPAAQVECADFPASEDTPGRVALGELSTGALHDESDRDWLRLPGLQSGRRYRLEVDFLGADVVGGSIDMFSSTLDRPVVHRGDLGDSNYDGHAVLDFSPLSPSLSTYYVQVRSDNGMNRSDDLNRFTGPYTVTLSEIPFSHQGVSNTGQRAADRLSFSNIGHDYIDGNEGHVVEMAVSFTTGTHADGYTLDRLTAYISMGRRVADMGVVRITGGGAAGIDIAPPPTASSSTTGH